MKQGPAEGVGYSGHICCYNGKTASIIALLQTG